MATRDSRPITRTAAADLSASLWKFVKETSAGINVCTVAGERADGILSGFFPSSLGAGSAVDVDAERLTKVITGGSFSVGDALTTDASGRAVLATANDNINAIAIEASTGANKIVGVRAPYSRGPSLGQTIADAAVSPATTASGTEVVIPILIPDAATATYTYVNTEKLEVVDVVVIKDAAGAGNTIQLKNGAGTAISDAIAAAVDKTVTRAGTLDKATRVLAAGAGFQITATRAAGSMAAAVFIKAIKRA